MMQLLAIFTSWLLMVGACHALDDHVKAALFKSYTPQEWGDSRATTTLLNALETASPNDKALLCVRLAEIERPFLADEKKLQWYKKAFDNDPNLIPALAGLTLVGLRQADTLRWIETWQQRDSSNALPHFALALSNALFLSNRTESLNAIANGNRLKMAHFRPLFTTLDPEQQSGWTREMRAQAYAEYATAHVLLSAQFDTMGRKLFQEADQQNTTEQRTLAVSLARMYDLLSCAEPFSTLKALRYTPLSIRSLERCMSGEPPLSEQAGKDIRLLIDLRRSFFDSVRTAEDTPDWVLGKQLRNVMKSVLECPPDTIFDQR